MSRTRACADRVGTVDDVSEGSFRLPFPPSYLWHDWSRTRVEARHARFKKFKLTILTD
jgi:predicted RNA methylase